LVSLSQPYDGPKSRSCYSDKSIIVQPLFYQILRAAIHYYLW
jgi:hypothetical protein